MPFPSSHPPLPFARLRSYANTISYLTPPAENAGLYKGLKELGELVSSYKGLRDSEARGPPIVNSIVASARQCNLDRDIPDMPAEDFDCRALTLDQRDNLVGKVRSTLPSSHALAEPNTHPPTSPFPNPPSPCPLKQVYQKIMEVESRLLPCGLHTVGVPPTAEEAIATLVNIASLDRPEAGVKALPRILAESIGRDINDIYRGANQGLLAEVELNQKITGAVREAVKAAVDGSTNAEGRVVEVENFFASGVKFLEGLMGIKDNAYKAALTKNGFPNAKDADLEPLFEYLNFCLKQVVADNELGALTDALNGRFTVPGPGGDPIRNPDVLPTGKNMHALDPQSIPTAAAVDCANDVVRKLIERLRVRQS